MKFIKILLQKLIVGAFFLYVFNVLFVSYNLMLPINVFSILFVSFLGPCGLFALLLFRLLFL